MLQLGLHEISGSEQIPREQWQTLSEALLNSCLDMYRATPTGLAPTRMFLAPPPPSLGGKQEAEEGVSLPPDGEGVFDLATSRRDVYSHPNPAFPETLESLFYFAYYAAAVEGASSDDNPAKARRQRFRDEAWRIFQSMERYQKSDFGYATVDVFTTEKKDHMESFVVAETTKNLS